jgi:hypothetical protein
MYKSGDREIDVGEYTRRYIDRWTYRIYIYMLYIDRSMGRQTNSSIDE